MQVNNSFSFTGNLRVGGRDITSLIDDTYENGQILIRGLIGGGYVSSSIWTTITTLKYPTDTWGTSSSSITQATKYGGWASSTTNGYVFLNTQNSSLGNNKVAFASETVTTIGNRTYGSEAPSSLQHGTGYDGTGAAYGTKAFTCGNNGTGMDILTFSTDTWTSKTDANIMQAVHHVAWFDKDYGYAYNGLSSSNTTYIMNFANETWATYSTTSSPVALGFADAYYLEKGLNTKRGKFYLSPAGSTSLTRVYQFRNNIAVWLTNAYNATLQNSEVAGTMGQSWGYFAGGYNTSTGQNAHSDKIYHETDNIVQISDAPRALSSASPMWSSI
jgi:hypothetical protein